MLKITFADSGKILSLQLVGHAGYARHGKDVVCSAASILAYTVAQFVSEAEGRGDIVASHVKLDSGDTVISCQPRENKYSDIQQVYLFARKGYELLAKNYPKYVGLMP